MTVTKELTMSIKPRYAFLVLPLVVLACSEEIPTEGGGFTVSPDGVQAAPPTPQTGTLVPVPVKDAGADASKVVVKEGDAGALALPLGCTTFGEAEPNDEETPQELGDGLCGTLIATDIDVFAGKSGKAAKTLRFSATGDAELVIRSLGAEKRVENGSSIEIPSFGPSIPFTIQVTSPADAPQAYRIVLED